jgi:endonuclease-3
MYEASYQSTVTEDSETVGGTYTVVVEVSEGVVLEVGALGEYEFDPGWYAYTGSAFGPGGFSRVARHQELAAGEHDARHWHIDYLLGHPVASIDAVIRSPGDDIECSVAASISGDPIVDFGSSDCDCRSHLHYADQRAPLLGSVHTAHTSTPGGEFGRSQS